MQTIDCHGTPRAMGQQYGEAIRDLISSAEAYFQIPRDLTLRAQTKADMQRIYNQHMPGVWDEMEGVAEGAGTTLDFILAINDQRAYMNPNPTGCTSLAIADGVDGPVLGKNNDTHGSTLSLIRRTRPTHGLPMIQIGYVGWLSGLDAMNAAGVVNSHNSVGSIYEAPQHAIDARMWAYFQMRRCETTAAFITAMQSLPLGGKGYNIVIVDEHGDTVVLEAALPMVVARDRGKPFVYATNHYVSEHLTQADRRKPEHKIVSVHRHGYLKWQDETTRPQSVADIKKILASPEPWSPCRHGGPHLAHTDWSILGLPRQRQLHVATGSPDENPYAIISL